LIIGWSLSLDVGLNLSQSYYNDDWHGSETGTITWTSFSNIEAKRSLEEWLHFTGILKLAYGQTYSQNRETKEWNPPEKSTDKIDGEGMTRFKVRLPVDPFLSLRILSQFYDGDNGILFNPVTLTPSIGFARTFYHGKKGEVVSRTGVAFSGVKDRSSKKTDLLEGGFEWVTWGSYKLSKNLFYEGRLRVYKYIYNSKAGEDKRWKAPDLDFENTLSVSLGKYLQLTLYLQMIYEKEQADRIQIKENIAFGLGAKIF
jgi:hypothetical protein